MYASHSNYQDSLFIKHQQTLMPPFLYDEAQQTQILYNIKNISTWKKLFLI